MSFVLDNSVTMRWFFGDGKPQELAYAGKVLDAMKDANAFVPVPWGLEVANVITRAEARALVTEARRGAFLEMLEGVDIEVDAATFAHALSATLQLARRIQAIRLPCVLPRTRLKIRHIASHARCRFAEGRKESRREKIYLKFRVALAV